MQDYLRNDNGEPLIENGDFVRGDASAQTAKKIMECHKGNNRQFPSSGFGISRFLKGLSDPKHFQRELRVELEADGFKDIEILNDGSGNIEFKV